MKFVAPKILLVASIAVAERTVTTFSLNAGWETRKYENVKGKANVGGDAADCRAASNAAANPLIQKEMDYCKRNQMGILLQQIQQGTDIITLQEDFEDYVQWIFGRRNPKKKCHKENCSYLNGCSTDLSNSVCKVSTGRELESAWLVPGQMQSLRLRVDILKKQLAHYAYRFGSDRDHSISQMWNMNTLDILGEPLSGSTTEVFEQGRPYMISTFEMRKANNKSLLLINAHGPHHTATSGFNIFFTRAKMAARGNIHLDQNIDFALMQGDLNRKVYDGQIQVELKKGKSVSFRNIKGSSVTKTYYGFGHSISNPLEVFKPEDSTFGGHDPEKDHILFANADDGVPVFTHGSFRALPTQGAGSDHAPVMGYLALSEKKCEIADNPLNSYGAVTLNDGPAVPLLPREDQPPDVTPSVGTRSAPFGSNAFSGNAIGGNAPDGNGDSPSATLVATGVFLSFAGVVAANKVREVKSQVTEQEKKDFNKQKTFWKAATGVKSVLKKQKPSA